MGRRIATTIGLSLVAVVLVLNFRIRDPLAELEALEQQVPVVTIVAPTTKPTGDGTTPTSAAPRYPVLPTTTSTTLATMPTSPGAVAVNGSEVETRFGPMQVQIIVFDGVIEDVVPLELPSATRTSRLLSRIHFPRLRAGTLDAQSGDVDALTGATVTWEAYVESLEIAIEMADEL